MAHSNQMKYSFSAWTRQYLNIMCCFALAVLVHFATQHQYHYRCKSNLLKVMLYGNSEMCLLLGAVARRIEGGAQTVALGYITGFQKITMNFPVQ